MRTPLSILGTASQLTGGSTPPAEIFYFSNSGSDYGNMSEWFMDSDLTIAASRVPSYGDDVVINIIPNLSPSLSERTYKTIVFSPLISCYDGVSFYKSGVKFIATGAITGAPACLISDLEAGGNIEFTNGGTMDININRLSGIWAAANISVSGYYHANDSESIPGMGASQITCNHYGGAGCIGFAIPGASGSVNLVEVTINEAGAASSVTVERCDYANINLNVDGITIYLAPASSDGIIQVGINASGTYSLVTSIDGVIDSINVSNGHAPEYSLNVNLNLLGSAAFDDIDTIANVSYESEAQYIASRASGALVSVSGLIYIAGFEHQRFTLSGGIIASMTYDLLIYDGSGFNLYDASSSFALVGRLNYFSAWDLSFFASFNVGSWASGTPPMLSDWSSYTSSPEPTWGTE